MGRGTTSQKRTSESMSALLAAFRKHLAEHAPGGPPSCLDAEAAARAAGCSAATLGRLTRAGVVLAVRIRGRRMFPRSEVRRLRARLQRAGSAPVLDLETTAEELGCTLAHVNELVRSGALLPVRVRGERMYPASDVRRLKGNLR